MTLRTWTLRLVPILALTLANCRSSSTMQMVPPGQGHDHDPADGGPGPVGMTDGGAGDSCTGVRCITPPAASCADAGHLRVYATAGTCGGGQCSYSPTLLACANGCANGACQGDPCAGVACNMPSANRCQDATQLRVFEHAGSCGSDGKCDYQSTLQLCAHGCDAAAGRCQDDPCAGVTCDTPDANHCEDASHLRVFEPAGSCGSDGKCRYDSSLQECAHGCDASVGRCKDDPCRGVTCNMPEPNVCQDSTHLRVYDSAGTCSDGGCVYGSKLQECSGGCDAGRCLLDPCAGKSCNSPQANYCQDSMHLVVFDPNGSCLDGGCRYTSTVQTCAFGCNGATGQCDQDPCLGKSCNTPPAATCTNSDTLRTYAPTTTCTAGRCDAYEFSEHPCDYGCYQGACSQPSAVALFSAEDHDDDPIFTTENGQLWAITTPYGATNPHPRRIGDAARWRELHGGWYGGCAVADDGTAYCWGTPGINQGSAAAPVQVGPTGAWRTLATNHSTTFAVKKDGTLWAWGYLAWYNRDGHLSPLPTENVGGQLIQPTQIGVASDWAAVDIDDQQLEVCGLGTSGQMRCWGPSDAAIRGHFDAPEDGGAPAAWTTVSNMRGHVCGLQSDQSLWCFGDDSWGAVGYDPADPKHAYAQKVGDGPWLAAGAFQQISSSCGLRADHTLWCWGNWGDLGDPKDPAAIVGTPLSMGSDTWKRLSPGHWPCAIRSDDSLWCWESTPLPTRVF